MSEVLEKKVDKHQRIKEIKKELRETERKLKDLHSENRTKYAQGLMDKIFAEFKASARWTEKTKKLAEEKAQVHSPNGRIRHLFAALTGNESIVAQQVRRGANAPIQGFASEIGVKAGRLIFEHYYSKLKDICGLLDIPYYPMKLRIMINRMVHDANYYTVPYSMVLPFIHIMQWCATYGVTEIYEKQFDLRFPVEPEIEIETGVVDDHAMKWDWSVPNLVANLIASVEEAEQIGILEGSKEEVIKTIFEPWRNKECRVWLQKHYPLLNVTDLNQQIVAAIRPIYKKKCATA